MEIKREDYFRESDSPFVRFCKYNYLSGNKYNMNISEFNKKCENDEAFRKLFYNESKHNSKIVLQNKGFIHPYYRFLNYNSESKKYPNLSKIEFLTRCKDDESFRHLFYTLEQWEDEDTDSLLNDEILHQRKLNFLFNKYIDECSSIDKIISYKSWYDSYGKFLKSESDELLNAGEADKIVNIEQIKKQRIDEETARMKQLIEKYKNISTKDLEEECKYSKDTGLHNVYKYRVKKENGKIIGKHYMYKFHLILGTVLTMSSCFWIPFLVGVIKALCEPFHLMSLSTAAITEGCLYVMAFIYFTNGILVPVTIVAGVTLWPMILKSIMFPHGEGYFAEHRYNDPLQHYENLMRDLKSGNIELKNAAAVIGSQFL